MSSFDDKIAVLDLTADQLKRQTKEAASSHRVALEAERYETDVQRNRADNLAAELDEARQTIAALETALAEPLKPKPKPIAYEQVEPIRIVRDGQVIERVRISDPTAEDGIRSQATRRGITIRNVEITTAAHAMRFELPVHGLRVHDAALDSPWFGIYGRGGSDWIIEDMESRGRHGLRIQQVDGLTVRRAVIRATGGGSAGRFIGNTNLLLEHYAVLADAVGGVAIELGGGSGTTSLPTHGITLYNVIAPHVQIYETVTDVLIEAGSIERLEVMGPGDPIIVRGTTIGAISGAGAGRVVRQ